MGMQIAKFSHPRVFNAPAEGIVTEAVRLNELDWNLCTRAQVLQCYASAHEHKLPRWSIT